MGDETVDDEVLVDYVSRALELRERGDEPRLEELCREHPELIERVAAMLARAPKLAGLATAAPEFDGLQGRVLEGRYRLVERLGAGAMGIVFRALDTKLGRAVAVKVLRPELFGGRDAEQRFLREAEVLASLHHPNVVAVHDRGSTADGISFLVMELLSGQPLVALLGEHERRVKENVAALDDVGFVAAHLGGDCELEATWLRQAVRWTADLAGGLGEAHRVGVLHRDVKPSNVYVGGDGHARLLDFGVAASTSHATLTAEGAALGTPGYMAPEVVADHAPATAASDVYGLGATLYHLLTRRPPYVGTVTNIIASLQRRDPIAVGKLRPGLPRDLHAIVDRAMARRVSERYASMAEFESDLRAFLNHQPVRARPLTAVDRVWRRLRRSPAARATAVVLGLLVVGAVLFEVRSFRDRSRQARELDAIAQLPPGLTLERPEFRVISDPVERAALSRLLDAAVDNAASPVPTRLLRAAFRLDHGQAAAAAEDMAVIAAAEPTAVSRALLAGYELAARDGGAGHESLRLGELPEPTSLRDRYLVSFHALRGRPNMASIERDIAWCESADQEWSPAHELLAGSLVFKAGRMQDSDSEAALAAFNRAQEIVVRVETQRGRRTATTANILGAALAGQQRYAEAVAVLAEGGRLSPYSNGILRNLARAQRRTGDIRGAIETCERGIRLRPGFYEHYETLGRCWTDLGDYERSRAVVQAAPVGEGAAGERLRNRLGGMNEYGIVLAQLRTQTADSRVAAEASAHRAMDALVAAGQQGGEAYAVCEAITSKNEVALVELFARRFASDPTDWLTTGNLGHVLTASLDEATTAQIKQGLLTLSRSQSPPRPVTAGGGQETPHVPDPQDKTK